MRTRLLALAGVVCAFLLLVPGISWAQSGIAGVVKDTSGAVLPGVTVEAASPALIEKVRSAVTDGDGNYKILDVRPGIYSVTFTLAGFRTVKRDGIELPAGFTATVTVELQVGSVEETITVTGAAPLVDVQSVTSQALLSQELIEAIPSARSLQGYAMLTPGVVGVGNLGATAGTNVDMRVAIHGAAQNESSYALDGVNQGSTTGNGSSMLYRNAQAYISEINVVTGGGNAELAYGAGMINIIPKEGGNSFTGAVFGEYSGEGMSTSNLTDGLRAQGFTANDVSSLLSKWEFSSSLGGRLVRNKLWFFGSYTYLGSIQTRAGVFDNLTPQGWAYTPDLSSPAEAEVDQVSENLRLTWQATPRNKITAYTDITPFASHHRGNEFPFAPEATSDTIYFPTIFATLSWKSPVTSRLLLDASAAHMGVDFNQRRHTHESCRCSAPDVSFSDVSVIEATTGQMWRSTSSAAPTGGQNYGHSAPSSMRYAANAAYITGSHASKVGVQFFNGRQYSSQEANGARAYTLRNGLPSSITQYANPISSMARVSAELGLFVQDQWTIKRLTLSGGLRYDYFDAGTDAQHLDAGLWVPARDFPATSHAPVYKDVNPRMAAAFDLFGDGKTAVKASFNRSEAWVGVGIAGNSPVTRSVLNVTRSWADANGNFNPDCDLVSPLANGECGQISNLNFGQNNPNATSYDPELLKGLRPYNWETTAQLQRQLATGVSVNAAYYRRNFFNFTATDNTLVTPADYSTYCITAPVDARLPGGGGNQICGLADVSPALFGRNLSVVRDAAHFGKQTQTYNGFDLTGNIRLPKGGQISGGSSWGRTATSSCFVVDSPGALQFCDVTPPFQPSASFVGFYPFPKWGMTLSATYRDLAPAQITATSVYTNAQIAPSLGRNLSNGVNGTVNVQLIQPGTMYAPRARQMDFRVSKRLQVGRSRMMANLDLFNLFNWTGVTTMNTTYGAQWQRPTLLQQGRYVQVSGQVDF